MIAFIIGLGIMMVIMIYIGTIISNNKRFNFDDGVCFGITFSMMFVIEVSMLSAYLKEPTPTSMDVYQGKTTLEYKMVDGVKTDSMVIFKNE